MKTRIPRMLAMMTRPPAVTIARAARSRRRRRGDVLRDTSARAGSGWIAVGTCAGSPMVQTLLELRKLLTDVLAEEGKIAVLDDDLLPLAREHEGQELSDERRQRFSGRLVDVDVKEAGERILARIDVRCIVR